MGGNNENEKNMEQWDLTRLISPFLDRHMMFPLLEYLDSLINAGTFQSYSTTDVATARLSLLRPTHMVDYAIDIYQSLHPDVKGVPKELEEQKSAVYRQLEELRAGCQRLDDLCQNVEERSRLAAMGEWNLMSISSSHGITMEMLDTYRQLAKFNFECGDYQTSRTMLTNYISLFAKPPPPSEENEDDDMLNPTNSKNSKEKDNPDIGNPSIYYLESITVDLLPVLWGKLAADILVEDWDAARVAIDAVKVGLESLVSSKQITALKALQQRTWLLHWSLFVYWNVPHGLEQMVDLFHSERYKQAITTNAPHLVRYLTAAVLLCKRRISKKSSQTSEARRLMKNLINVMQDCEYNDPIVEFVHNLCVKYDFDQAQLKLAECEAVLDADFFLCKQTALFMEEARVFVFEHYCRIHHKIHLEALGEKLAMDSDCAERWMVDLIRNADLDAKIDNSCVVMGSTQSQSTHHQVMERTRDLNVRSATLAQNLKSFLQEQRKEKAKKSTRRSDDY
mmetsp:Transcript_30488/g.34750  ORF Transcript_30488/g.34750 Transcript_30488/m.34750 type:complete len:508 (+) Transcript_30488:205-1728(+)|eukprot:CAMPEP_0194134418 /NCGR_PEP_ID=MMETSP0152-20130528/4504_1 /TAXON_ID=1049557 /ORGANISM="Thalassiothrix antarctica, Strain L6-D1" /LENGTH=507 /DNA_ID=CAMNT_0038830145 /DNA_START=156 /DNA_END=1679 /DNA_ORIENTATION=-